jgi:hypothetical protein
MEAQKQKWRKGRKSLLENKTCMTKLIWKIKRDAKRKTYELCESTQSFADFNAAQTFLLLSLFSP